MSYISVDELAKEIFRHHDSDVLRMQVAELRERKIDLKRFCSNVRIMAGPQVLLDTVKGLQSRQVERTAVDHGSICHSSPGVSHSEMAVTTPGEVSAPQVVAPAAAAIRVKAESVTPDRQMELPVALSTSPRTLAMPPPPPTTTMANSSLFPHNLEGGFSGPSSIGIVHPPSTSGASSSSNGSQIDPGLLKHALLCGRDVCTISGCNSIKEKLKMVLQHDCSNSNLPGGQQDCATCKKRLQLARLKEQTKRKLIELAKKQVTCPSEFE